MTFTCTIDCDNAAFGETEDARAMELGQILRRVIGKVENGHDSAAAYDTNGNRVGSYTITDESHESRGTARPGRGKS
jgi:hypothetical protein